MGSNKICYNTGGVTKHDTFLLWYFLYCSLLQDIHLLEHGANPYCCWTQTTEPKCVFLCPALSCHVWAAGSCSASPRLSSSALEVKGRQVFGSNLCGDVRGECYTPQRDNTTHISAHLFPKLTGWSVCLGELIVFRWDNLRRGSGREDRSKGLREKSGKAEGYKLTMCRIFVSTWVLVRKLHTLYLFLSLGAS